MQKQMPPILVSRLVLTFLKLQFAYEKIDHAFKPPKSLKIWEIRLTNIKICGQKALRDAEQKVEILTQQNGDEQLENFDPND